MEENKNKVYGIDLGTTYSVIATLDGNGMPEVIKNNTDASDLCASAVYFPEDGDVVVGKQAKEMKIEEPGRVVELVKRFIGKDNAPTWEFNGEKYDPISISALILKRMKEYADAQGEDVRNVVITCPAYFGNTEKMATRQAGVTAGLNVLGIINEPTAAALNYCSNEFNENRKIMVYDLGGGTFDVTLLDFTVDDESGSAVVDIVRSGGDDRLGGADWDGRLLNLMLRKYASEVGIDETDVDEDSKGLIRSKVEDTKIALSNLPKRNVTLPGLGRVEVTRQNFEDATRDLVERTMDFVRKLLSDSECAPDDIDLVLLVGGSTRMPMILQAVEALFPGKVKVHDPDLAVAKGAALYAAKMQRVVIREIEKKLNECEEKNKDVELTEEEKQAIGIEGEMSSSSEQIASVLSELKQDGSFGSSNGADMRIADRLSRSLGPGVITALNDKLEYMIDNLLFLGDEMPARAEKTYGTPVDNCRQIVIRVFENISEDRVNTYVTPCVGPDGKDQNTDPALKVKLIGDLQMQLPPNLPENSPISVTFQSSADGLEVVAVSVTTGEKVRIVITSKNLHSEKEINEEKKRFANILTSGSV